MLRALRFRLLTNKNSLLFIALDQMIKTRYSLWVFFTGAYGVAPLNSVPYRSYMPC
jgi:hypothetical protein